MSSTVDANVLLYASDSASPYSEQARRLLQSFAEQQEFLYLFWPTAMAYLRIATHPAIFREPMSPADAVANLEVLMALPSVRMPGEGDGFWRVYRAAVEGHVVRGNLVPDAHLVALMRQYDVDTIWTRDGDFRRFAGIRVRDPFA